MIARVGFFEGLTDQQKAAQEDNGNRRFKAAIRSQPGIVALFFLERPNGDRVSFSVWESQNAMELGGERANAAPLLPGQHGEDIPSANRVEVWKVRDHFLGSEPAGSNQS